MHFGGESSPFKCELHQNLHPAPGLLTLHGETLMISGDDKAIKTAGSFQSIMADRMWLTPLHHTESY